MFIDEINFISLSRNQQKNLSCEQKKCKIFKLISNLFFCSRFEKSKWNCQQQFQQTGPLTQCKHKQYLFVFCVTSKRHQKKRRHQKKWRHEKKCFVKRCKSLEAFLEEDFCSLKFKSKLLYFCPLFKSPVGRC